MKTINISVDKKYCKGCQICINTCPKGVFALSEERQSYGTLLPYVADKEKCMACKLCEIMCPNGCINVDKEDL
ncbi:MAG: ferredoxin family protein [Clostridia bacterium]|nr:ferredoxin family protein [Clostridia bacterium]